MSGTVIRNPAVVEEGLAREEEDEDVVPPTQGRRPSYLRMGGDTPRKRSSVGALTRDFWDVTQDIQEEEEDAHWTEKSPLQKTATVAWIAARIFLALASLYFFICSLDFLSNSFQLLGGKSAGEAFSKAEIMQNPIVGLMMGVLVTVLVQSSSTSSSIIVSMVAAGIVQMRPAVNLIMGANIGTTVTNTIVSLGQSMDRKQFRRAFAGATVHDCFNWLCVAIFLPLEAAFHPIERLSHLIVSGISEQASEEEPDFLTVLTKPFTKLVIRMETKEVLDKMTQYCESEELRDEALCNYWKDRTLMKACYSAGDNETMVDCGFLFSNRGLSDAVTGLFLLAISLFLLILCLTTLVKILQSLLMGSVAAKLKKYINSNLPGRFEFLTGYIFLVIGMVLTFLLQSSSVFTSTLTPLVGLGVISIERMYPLTLGSNIGTTTTSMLAALASQKSSRKRAIQIAVCHLLFNISGILVFFPIPITRQLPLQGAKFLGTTTAKYRWFAVMYLLVVFIVAPLSLLGLSLIHPTLLLTVVVIFILLLMTVLGLNLLQSNAPHWLPHMLKNWYFLPEWMRSLQPLDRVITTVLGKIPCCRKITNASSTLPAPAHQNGTPEHNPVTNQPAGPPINGLESVPEKKVVVTDKTTTI